MGPLALPLVLLLAVPLPDAPAFDDALAARLAAAWNARPAGYEPRTRHRDAQGRPLYTNRLFLEASPYLLQHAHNPVNWYPWGEEAFATARARGCPVLLSIGYSTCHWCHVMEEESFEDETIARTLNRDYVAVKVDREEQPAVDAAYLEAVTAMTGDGGWPMTVWVTPDRLPFFGGTYFPAHDGDRGARTGFLTLLTRLAESYREHPDRAAKTGAALTRQLAERRVADPGGHAADTRVLDTAFKHFAATFDSANGGAKGAPKFPSRLPVRFLLRHYHRTRDAHALHMAVLTLEQMARGGIHDQLGGGFHRYATDERWLVPHFEKMLYDNAQLAVAYLEGYQATGREDFATVARSVLDDVAGDLTAPEGGFYSARDADSPAPSGAREEGRFFTWTPAEIEAAVGPAEARLASAYFDVTAAGRVEGRSVLHTPRSIEEVARALGVAPDAARQRLDEARTRLRAARDRRPPPLRDEKILTAWNGLTISAFARAALVLGDAGYADRAARAADFLLTRMRRDHHLFRAFEGGAPRHEGGLGDYAFLIAALLDLYEATGVPRWLEEAIDLDTQLASAFADKDGGFFLTAEGADAPLGREKPSEDNVEPSGNSVAAMNLLRLALLSGDPAYAARAERTLAAFSPILTRSPESLSEMLLAVQFSRATPQEIVIVVPTSRAQAEPFLSRLRTAFLPDRVLVIAAAGADLEAQARRVPLLREKKARNGRATAYVCEHQTCKLPTDDPDVFARQLAAP